MLFRSLSVSTKDSPISTSKPLEFTFALRNSLLFHSGLAIQIGLVGDSISFPPSPLAYCKSVPCLPTNLVPAFMFTDISSSSSLYGGLTTVTVITMTNHLNIQAKRFFLHYIQTVVLKRTFFKKIFVSCADHFSSKCSAGTRHKNIDQWSHSVSVTKQR